MKKNIVIGLMSGAVAGLIDVTPMVFMKLSFIACLSAFSMWTFIGFLLATSTLKMNAILKGLLISFGALLPTALIIGDINPEGLIPIISMTLLLGSILGFTVNKILK